MGTRVEQEWAARPRRIVRVKLCHEGASVSIRRSRSLPDGCVVEG